jgi:hypothetical protein
MTHPMCASRAPAAIVQMSRLGPNAYFLYVLHPDANGVTHTSLNVIGPASTYKNLPLSSLRRGGRG